MKSGVSLQQMLTEVKRQSESKEDYLIAPNRLRMESYGKEMFLHLSDDSGTELIEPMTITGIAHRQIGTHLRIPAAYYDRMREERPDLLAYNANTCLLCYGSTTSALWKLSWAKVCLRPTEFRFSPTPAAMQCGMRGTHLIPRWNLQSKSKSALWPNCSLCSCCPMKFWKSTMASAHTVSL